jgi:hypothetical protein
MRICRDSLERQRITCAKATANPARTDYVIATVGALEQLGYRETQLHLLAGRLAGTHETSVHRRRHPEPMGRVPSVGGAGLQKLSRRRRDDVRGCVLAKSGFPRQKSRDGLPHQKRSRRKRLPAEAGRIGRALRPDGAGYRRISDAARTGRN